MQSQTPAISYCFDKVGLSNAIRWRLRCVYDLIVKTAIVIIAIKFLQTVEGKYISS